VSTKNPVVTVENSPDNDNDPGVENFNFVQFNRAHLKNWRALIRKAPLAAEILMFLVEKMGRTSNAVVCSYKVLTELTGYSRTSVATAIATLKSDNWIATVKVGNATAYAVNERAVWTAARNQRRYAIFSATVIAGETEQESDFFKKANEKLRFVPFVGAEERILLTNEDLPPPDQKDLDLN